MPPRNLKRKKWSKKQECFRLNLHPYYVINKFPGLTYLGIKTATNESFICKYIDSFEMHLNITIYKERKTNTKYVIFSFLPYKDIGDLMGECTITIKSIMILDATAER